MMFVLVVDYLDEEFCLPAANPHTSQSTLQYYCGSSRPVGALCFKVDCSPFPSPYPSHSPLFLFPPPPQLRSWKSTILQLFAPCFFLVVVTALSYLPQGFENVTNPPDYPVGTLPKCTAWNGKPCTSLHGCTSTGMYVVCVCLCAYMRVFACMRCMEWETMYFPGCNRTGMYVVCVCLNCVHTCVCLHACVKGKCKNTMYQLKLKTTLVLGIQAAYMHWQ